MLLTSIAFLPLLGAVISGFLHTLIGEKVSMVVTSTLVCISCIFSWVIFFSLSDGDVGKVILSDWISSGNLRVSWALRFDSLTTVMLTVITSVSSLVHIYSFGYMNHDENFTESESYKPRFFAYLSLFTFMMLMLVTADNFLQMFFGWEGVGLASYLLIGFYYKKPSANSAALKAFVVNRVGDFGFMLGIFGIFYLFGTLTFDNIFSNVATIAQNNNNLLEIFAIFLFVGAMGKSAQLFLHTWLPDAMEGPTPVSALIHAATMVTAGVFLVCRISPILEHTEIASLVITVVGTATAFFAASVALVQQDIKRIIAYSTCSQLGFMFAAAGVGFYQAAMFHLFTHAFFKALLFLSAGSVIHGLHHEQNIFKMGGLKKQMPYTFFAMLVGTLAITGVGFPLLYDYIHIQVGFAGFSSKDAIIEGIYASNSPISNHIFWTLIIAATLTSFYSWRLIFVAFFGNFVGGDKKLAEAHESPLSMIVPLGILAIGSIFAGAIFYDQFVGNNAKSFFENSIFMSDNNHILKDFHYVPWWVKMSPFGAMLIGLILSAVFYLGKSKILESLYKQHYGLYSFLYKKWYFDEMYQYIFVIPMKKLGMLFWEYFDGGVINKFLNLVSLSFIPRISKDAGAAQTGFVTHYAFVMIIGFVAVTVLLISFMVV